MGPRRAALGFLLLCLSPGWTAAAGPDNATVPDRPRGLSVGPALVAGQPVYRGTGHANRLLVPFLGYEGEAVYLRGLRAGYRAWTPGGLTVDFVAQPRLDQLDPDDSDVLSGMALRRRTLEAGLAAGWGLGGWRFAGSVLTDVLNRHGGQEAEIGLGYRVGPPFAFVRPQLSITWQSKAMTDYYYGVRADEARPGRPAYSAGAAINPAVGATGRYSFSRRWSAFGLVRHTWLGNAISDSPIVARSGRWSAVLALSYTFR